MKQRCTTVHQCVTWVCIDFPRELPVRKSHHIDTQTPATLTGAMLHALKLKLPLRNLALWSFSMVAISTSSAISISATAPSVTQGVGNLNWTLVPKGSNCTAWENKFCVFLVQLTLNQKSLDWSGQDGTGSQATSSSGAWLHFLG